jgi:hypothetical protein
MRYRDLFPGPRSNDFSVSSPRETESHQPAGAAVADAMPANLDAKSLARWLRGLPDGDSKQG